MAIAARRMRESLRSRDHGRACIAVYAVARRGGKACMQRLTVQPLREERRHHVVAHGEIADGLAYRFHHASTVGHRDAAIGGWHLSADNAQVMEIQRTGMQPHADLACRGLAGIGNSTEVSDAKPAGCCKRMPRIVVSSY